MPSRKRVALPLLIMAVIYGISSLPGVPLADQPRLYGLFYWAPPTVQNALHVPAYAVLAFAWRWALSTWSSTPRTKTIGAWLITSVYGVLDEWHQSYVPGRYASLMDVSLDVLGTAVGISLGAWNDARTSGGEVKSKWRHDQVEVLKACKQRQENRNTDNRDNL